MDEIELLTSTEIAPRPPHQSEIQELADWLVNQGHDLETAIGTAQGAYVAIYDRYVTDCPCYVGKLMSVVWSGSPTFFDVFTWEQESLVRNGREFDLKECDRCGKKNGTYCWNCWRTANS